MSEELNCLLKKVYYCYKEDINPPVPIEIIKEFLELEGIVLGDKYEE